MSQEHRSEAAVEEENDRLRREVVRLTKKNTELEQLLEMNKEHAELFQEELLDKIELSLRESERRFRLITETIPVPVIVCRNTDTKILYANEPASDLFSLPLEALLVSRFDEFCNAAERERIDELLHQEQRVRNYEFQGIRSDETPFWGAIFTQSLVFNNEHSVLVALYDMTDRKRAEEEIRTLNEDLEQRVEERTQELQQANEALKTSLDTLKITQNQLIQAEKMVALGGLVAGVAHEINTPLGVGVTSASFLDEKTQDLEKLYQQGQISRSALEDYLKTARQSTALLLRNLHRAADHVQSFKQIAVDQTNEEKRRFLLNTYINDLLLSLRSKLQDTRHTVTVYCPEPIEIASYPGAFSQIITHLFLNTLHHAFDGVEQGEITLNLHKEQDSIVLTFGDNGNGISTEQQTRIFEPFYTTKRGKGATGLGLYIIYNLVTQRLNGSIDCTSSPGEGTTFSITIPLEQQ